jgi:hypothetical protein
MVGVVAQALIWSKEKKWSLWRAALYGLIAGVILFVINDAANGWQEFSTWSQARPSEVISFAIGRFGFPPVLFVLVAASSRPQADAWSWFCTNTREVPMTNAQAGLLVPSLAFTATQCRTSRPDVTAETPRPWQPSRGR